MLDTFDDGGRAHACAHAQGGTARLQISALQLVQQMDGDVRIGHSGDALAAGDVIVFAVPGAAVTTIVDANAELLAGKIIIDASNNMRGASRHALDHLRRSPVEGATDTPPRWTSCG